jgi:Pyruvate/2-oxoacid:ferredoxin oxidoreductase delta subunit
MSKYDVVMGAVIPKPRSSVENKTGGWRTRRPVIDVGEMRKLSNMLDLLSRC